MILPQQQGQAQFGAFTPESTQRSEPIGYLLWVHPEWSYYGSSTSTTFKQESVAMYCGISQSNKTVSTSLWIKKGLANQERDFSSN